MPYHDPYNLYDDEMRGAVPPQSLVGGIQPMAVPTVPTIGYQQPERRVSPVTQYKTPSIMPKRKKEEDKPGKDYDPTGKTPEQIMAETGRQSEVDVAKKQEAFKAPTMMTPQPRTQPVNGASAQRETSRTIKDTKPVDIPDAIDVRPKQIEGGQGSLLSTSGPITQQYGNRSAVEKYSGGVNYGTDFGVPKGTKVAAPPGDWKVVESFDKAKVEGPNNAQGGINRGYGNSVLIENKKTGEKMRYSHLTVGGVNVKQGQDIKGGDVLGATGATGNTAGRTGQHLDLEYYEKGKTRPSDVLKSQYAGFVTGKERVAPKPEIKPETALQTPQAPKVSPFRALPDEPLRPDEKDQFTNQIFSFFGGQ